MDVNSTAQLHFKVQVVLIIENTNVKCKVAIKVLFIYLNVCLGIKLDNLSCSCTSLSFLIKRGKLTNNCASKNNALQRVYGSID